MNIFDKLYGPTGVAKGIDNIVTHLDEDSNVRQAALDEIIRRCEAGKARIQEETAAEVAAALAPPAVAEEA